jgi:antitoxin component of RelBE/YafQ-DinJ toxin-antitoxin module
MVEKGNIPDLFNRKVLRNPDGSWSTTSSMSFEEKGVEILIPTVINGKRLPVDERYPEDDPRHFQASIDRYHKTGQHLGKFKDGDSADAFAQSLHEEQERKNKERP